MSLFSFNVKLCEQSTKFFVNLLLEYVSHCKYSMVIDLLFGFALIHHEIKSKKASNNPVLHYYWRIWTWFTDLLAHLPQWSPGRRPTRSRTSPTVPRSHRRRLKQEENWFIEWKLLKTWLNQWYPLHWSRVYFAIHMIFYNVDKQKGNICQVEQKKENN